MSHINRWSVIYQAENTLEAHMIKGLLESEGIDVRLQGESLFSGMGELPAEVIEVAVMVPDTRQDEARNLLDKYANSAARSWFCSSCGELNEGCFEICWHCQREYSGYLD